MTTLAAAGDTWGISGPTFIGLYLVLALAVFLLATATRRARTNPPGSRAPHDLSARPHDVAYLNGGASLAVLSALGSLRLRGLVSSQRGTVTAIGRIDAGADDLERAIHFATAAPTQRARLPINRSVSAALAAIEGRLVDTGLLLSPAQRNRIRGVGLWLLAVVAFGFVRLLAGVAEAKPVGFLVAALIGVTGVAVFQLARAPRRTMQANTLLAELRAGHDELHPRSRPDWAVYGPAGAALGIGLFGASALWASDPALAEEFAARTSFGSGGDGGASWSGFSGGGDSGGGGGGGGDSGGGGGGGCGG